MSKLSRLWLGMATLVSAIAGAQDDGATKNDAPRDNLFEFAAGPDDAGNVGATLRADLLSAPQWMNIGPDLHGYYGLKGDSKWLSAPDASNQSELGAQLGVLVFKDWPMFYGAETAFEVGAEAQYRLGRFENAGGTVQEANQLLWGAGINMQLPWGYLLTNLLTDLTGDNPKVPRLQITHYWLDKGREEASAFPEELKTDNLVVGLSADLPLVRLGFGDKLMMMRLLVQGDLTKPTNRSDTDWQEFAELKLVLDTGQELRPALVYASGARNGLQYDKQTLVALLWSLGGGAGVATLAPVAEDGSVGVVPVVGQ